MGTPHPALDRAREYAAELTATVQAVLPSSPDFQAMVLESRLTIGVFTSSGSIGVLPLFIDGRRVAHWKLSMLVDLDSAGQHLKVMKSNFSVTAEVDATPLVRYEFDDAMRTAPVAHWQFHGERGAFSHLLGQAQFAGKNVKPHSLSSVHFPVGGGRMRPGVDDLLEFLVREFGFDACPAWEAAVQVDRDRYRRIQARTIMRDMTDELVATLRSEGWIVTPPDGYVAGDGAKFLKRW